MDNLIVLPDAPALADLSFRPILGVQDANVLLAVHSGRIAHDQVDPLSSFEAWPSRRDLNEKLAQVLAEGRQDRWLVAQVGEQAAGYSHIAGWPEGDGTWVYLTLGWVLPEWRSRGIGTAMLHWAEDRIRRLAAAEQPGARFEFAANASSTEKEATSLLVHEGYRAEYTVLEMGLDLSAPTLAHSLPPGTDVRPALPNHYLLIATNIGEAYQHEYEGGRFREEFDPVDYAVGLSASKHDPSLWQVAWAGDQVIGQVLSIIQNGRAEVFEVSVRPDWRRRGLGRALLARALLVLRARGVDAIRLGTVSEFRTRARDLYRSVGFRVLKEFPRYRKPSHVEARETKSSEAAWGAGEAPQARCQG